ncbi:hypothetical protein Tco_0228856 [Tanacetum coccineum]
MSVISVSFETRVFLTLSGWGRVVHYITGSMVIHPRVGSNIMKNSSDICERPVTELVEFIRAHQHVSLVLVKIDDSLRILVCSVWCPFGDVGPECLWPGDI